MIHVIEKDITIVKGPAIIMHGVNCQGRMASGVAKALFTKWPIIREKYLELSGEEMKLGKVQLVQVEDNLFVANCFTQEFYGYDGKRYADPNAIFTAAKGVLLLAYAKDCEHIYLPKIGCGLGGLDYLEDVKPQLSKALIMSGSTANFYVCEL